MFTRDAYIALLEKRASDEAEATTSVEAVNQDFNKTTEDDRQYLHGVFSRAGEVESDQSSAMRKLFPGVEGKKVPGNPLMKLASRDIFFDAIRTDVLFNKLKTASPIVLEMTFSAFHDELEKIAALKPQTLSQVAQKNQVAMSRPAKAWNIQSPAAAGAAGTKLPQGSGTTANQGGFLSRLLGR